METSLINRLQATLLALATVGLVVLAGLNFWQERHTQQPPDDGVWWREAADGSGLVADKVLPNSPGERAGIRERDLLTGVSSPACREASDRRCPATSSRITCSGTSRNCRRKPASALATEPLLACPPRLKYTPSTPRRARRGSGARPLPHRQLLPDRLPDHPQRHSAGHGRSR